MHIEQKNKNEKKQKKVNHKNLGRRIGDHPNMVKVGEEWREGKEINGRLVTRLA